MIDDNDQTDATDTRPPVTVETTIPARVHELVERSIARGVYASFDDFVAEALRERLRMIGGSYHTISIDLAREADALTRETPDAAETAAG